MRFNFSAGRSAQALPQFRRGQEPVERVGQAGRIIGRDQQAVALGLDELWNPRNRGRDHGNPAAHRLQQHVGNAVAISVTGYDTRKHEYRSPLVRAADHVVTLRTDEPHTVIQAESRHLVFKDLTLGATADDLNLKAAAPPPKDVGGHDQVP